MKHLLFIVVIISAFFMTAGIEIAAAAEIPKWIEKMNFKGDVRLRYQGEEQDDSIPGEPKAKRDRGRYRLRVGVESEVNQQWTAGFRIASGGDDPRSTNETLQDTFSSKGLRIDKAYAEYQPIDWLSLTGGKFGNPIWGTKDLLWDSDITTEGAAAKLKWKISPGLEIFATPAFFLLDHFGGNNAFMAAIQGGLNWKFTDSMYFKLAPAYYKTDNVKGSSKGTPAGPSNLGKFSSFTNSVDTANRWVFAYDSFTVDAEIGFTKITDFIPYAALFGQYVKSDASAAQNIDNLDDDTGYLFGIKFGHPKVSKLFDWQASYNYRRLERDAWFDFLPDSDFFGGGTNAKGHEFEFVLGVYKNVTLGLDYYDAELIRVPVDQTSEQQKILQADLVIKF